MVGSRGRVLCGGWPSLLESTLLKRFGIVKLGGMSSPEMKSGAVQRSGATSEGGAGWGGRGVWWHPGGCGGEGGVCVCMTQQIFWEQNNMLKECGDARLNRSTKDVAIATARVQIVPADHHIPSDAPSQSHLTLR